MAFSCATIITVLKRVCVIRGNMDTHNFAALSE